MELGRDRRRHETGSSNCVADIRPGWAVGLHRDRRERISSNPQIITDADKRYLGRLGTRWRRRAPCDDAQGLRLRRLQTRAIVP
jgi:hypothetical protein